MNQRHEMHGGQNFEPRFVLMLVHLAAMLLLDTANKHQFGKTLICHKIRSIFHWFYTGGGIPGVLYHAWTVNEFIL